MAFDDISLPKSVTAETVNSVEHYSDNVFSLRITRPSTFRFRSGEFVMAGLLVDGKPLLRAYSVASPVWDEEIELYSIKVQDGPLTSRLQHIKPGDQVLLGKKPTGTLVLDALEPGKRLIMISTGTGIAPFASLIRDPDVYECFDEVILTHTCRDLADLTYGQKLAQGLPEDPLVGEVAPGKFKLFNTTTRETSPHMGRITNLIRSGEFYSMANVAELNPATDRVMICGSMEMLKETQEIVEGLGFEEGANNNPGDYVIEKAFVG
ncbi:MAG: ferredoxin--NADP reductase [Pseudomonadota bacterium]